MSGPGRRALVLGGGGVAGIAWLTGLVAAFDHAGVDVSAADFVLGTSAGATVAAQVASSTGADEWFRRQVDPALQNRELRPPGLSVAELWEAMVLIAEEVADPVERRRRVGALALGADTVPEAVRRAVVAGRLPGDGGWPDRRIAVVAVDASTGGRQVFEARSGVGLVDAVAASSAVPGIWPPVTIGQARYVDGGVHSSANADLVVGFPLSWSWRRCPIRSWSWRSPPSNRTPRPRPWSWARTGHPWPRSGPNRSIRRCGSRPPGPAVPRGRPSPGRSAGSGTVPSGARLPP